MICGIAFIQKTQLLQTSVKVKETQENSYFAIHKLTKLK